MVDAKLPDKLNKQVTRLFQMMDEDNSLTIEKDEVRSFFENAGNQ